jgi:hypothetical protein
MDKNMKFSAWYGIVVGLGMIAQWTFFILSGNVPEFQSEPWRIALHLAGEMTTALALIVSGIATLKSAAWGKSALLLGLGMVIYSEIVSPGYFAQLGQWSLVAMFAILLCGAIISVMILWFTDFVKKNPKNGSLS